MFPLRITFVAFAALLAGFAVGRPLPVDGAVKHVEGHHPPRSANHPAPAAAQVDYRTAAHAQLDAFDKVVVASQSASLIAEDDRYPHSVRKQAASLAAQCKKTAREHGVTYQHYAEDPATAADPAHAKALADKTSDLAAKSFAITHGGPYPHK